MVSISNLESKFYTFEKKIEDIALVLTKLESLSTSGQSLTTPMHNLSPTSQNHQAMNSLP